MDMSFLGKSKSYIITAMIAAVAGFATGKATNKTPTTVELQQQYSVAMQTDSTLREFNKRLKGGVITKDNLQDFENLVRLIYLGENAGRPIPEDARNAVDGFFTLNEKIKTIEETMVKIKQDVEQRRFDAAVERTNYLGSPMGAAGSLTIARLDVKKLLGDISTPYAGERLTSAILNATRLLAAIPSEGETGELHGQLNDVIRKLKMNADFFK
jgi:hypothetical protein